jgi:hypothetical protein
MWNPMWKDQVAAANEDSANDDSANDAKHAINDAINDASANVDEHNESDDDD